MKIVLTKDEALVLFEWLASAKESDYTVNDKAVQIVLWKLEGLLEKEIPTIFDRKYSAMVDGAKRRILGR